MTQDSHSIRSFTIEEDSVRHEVRQTLNDAIGMAIRVQVLMSTAEAEFQRISSDAGDLLAGAQSLRKNSVQLILDAIVLAQATGRLEAFARVTALAEPSAPPAEANE